MDNVKSITKFNSHFYEVEVDGKIAMLPSVTTKQSIENKPGLVKWYQNVGMNAPMLLDQSADRGSRVHDALEKAMKGATIIMNNPKAPEYSDSDLSSFGRYHVMQYDNEYEMALKGLNLINSWKCSDIHVEEIIYNLNDYYAGRADLRMSIVGEVTINRKKVALNGHYLIDWKTGGAYEQHPEQGVAYAKAIEQMHGRKIDGVLLVYLDAKTKSGVSVKLIERKDFDTHYEVFMAVSKLYDLRMGRKIIDKVKMPSTAQFNGFGEQLGMKL